jgi:subtilase family serine protease
MVGNPADGVRDIPDVSLFAADGVWGHYYVYCWSDTVSGGASCTGVPDTWSHAGGTSFSSSIMAGVQALINQATNESWGNANTGYYSLARAEYGASGNTSCNSTSGNQIGSTCTFNDVTFGDMDVPCTALNGTLHNCYDEPGVANGVLSTTPFVNTDTLPSVAYGARTGWDFGTGIGTVNSWNLIQGFVKILK